MTSSHFLSTTVAVAVLLLCCLVSPATALDYKANCFAWAHYSMCPHRYGLFFKPGTKWNDDQYDCPRKWDFKFGWRMCTNEECCVKPDPTPEAAKLCQDYCAPHSQTARGLAYSRQNHLKQCTSACDVYSQGMKDFGTTCVMREGFWPNSDDLLAKETPTYIGCALGVGMQQASQATRVENRGTAITARCYRFCDEQPYHGGDQGMHSGTPFCKNYCDELGGPNWPVDPKPTVESCHECYHARLTDKEFRAKRHDMEPVWKQEACHMACNWFRGAASFATAPELNK
jgi:hypothetical protein